MRNPFGRKMATLPDNVIEVGSANEVICGECGHWRSAHILGACALCALAGIAIARKEKPSLPVQLLDRFRRLGAAAFDCRERFPTLPARIMEQARLADKGSYHEEMPCKECGQPWMVHTGYLCPSMLTLFVPALSERDPAFISG